MLKTKAELEDRVNREKQFLEEQKKQHAMKEELREAKENIKQKIAENIHATADNVDPASLEKAAGAIAEEKANKGKGKKKESLLSAIGETLGESLEDLSDSIGAVASVVADKIQEAIHEAREDKKEEEG
jgi:hypothetical protein